MLSVSMQIGVGQHQLVQSKEAFDRIVLLVVASSFEDHKYNSSSPNSCPATSTFPNPISPLWRLTGSFSRWGISPKFKYIPAELIDVLLQGGATEKFGKRLAVTFFTDMIIHVQEDMIIFGWIFEFLEQVVSWSDHP